MKSTQQSMCRVSYHMYYHIQELLRCMLPSNMRHSEATSLYTLHRLYCLFALRVCKWVFVTRPEVKTKRPAHSWLHIMYFIVSSSKSTNNSICLQLWVWGIQPVNWYSWNLGDGFTVRLSRDAGRLTALMAIKISGRMWRLRKPQAVEEDERESLPQAAPSPRGGRNQYLSTLTLEINVSKCCLLYQTNIDDIQSSKPTLCLAPLRHLSTIGPLPAVWTRATSRQK